MEAEELDSFYFKETVAGVEHDYRITQNLDYYGVERDGEVIAKLQLNDSEQWNQTEGEPLSSETIQKIGRKIESRYD